MIDWFECNVYICTLHISSTRYCILYIDMLNDGSSKLLFILFKDYLCYFVFLALLFISKRKLLLRKLQKNQRNKLYAENKYKAVSEKVHKIVLLLSNIIGYLETLLFRVILCSVGYNTY